jgi:hypothetical protein
MRACVAAHGRCELRHHTHVFLRLKERCFVNLKQPEACGLTIGGWYYLAVERSTGSMRGFYCDPCPLRCNWQLDVCDRVCVGWGPGHSRVGRW